MLSKDGRASKHALFAVSFQCHPVRLVTVQTAHMVMYYFLITTLIIFPTATIAAVLGIVGGTRFRRQRRKVGSFDAAQVWLAVEGGGARGGCGDSQVDA